MAKLQQLQIGPGTLSYPKVSRPDTYGEYADNKYKTAIVLPADHPSAVAAKVAILTLAKEHGVTKIITEGKTKNVPYTEDEDGNLVFNAKTKDQPWIGDAKNRKLPDNVLVGGGTVAKIAIALNPWTKKTKVTKSNPTGEDRGVNAYLNAVQVLDLVAYTSRESSPFDEEDGYEFEGGYGGSSSDSSDASAESSDDDAEIPF